MARKTLLAVLDEIDEILLLDERVPDELVTDLLVVLPPRDRAYLMDFMVGTSRECA